VQPRPAAHRNVPGDFSVDADCCTLCGVPWLYAPDLFGYDNGGCWVKKQPTTALERSQMIVVMQAQEFDCIRYKGSDSQVRAAISLRPQIP